MNPNFLLIFSTTVGITIFAFCSTLYLAAQPQLSQEQIQIFDNCNKISMGGTLTIFGLLARRKLLD
jgi:hypothetical protein